MDDVALDLERLERCRSIVNSEVQSIESSLNWRNTSSLLKAIEDLKVQMQRTDIVLEQGILKIRTQNVNLVSLQNSFNL